ncbi:MAG: hypothetical protein KJ623_00180 [Nanoarchaeota archaeon]|nr:hypothetical protein [Nanoarchaeota archaeon]MBU0963301.1 hypothetical protein [Nanoarchaeota archaeon]
MKDSKKRELYRYLAITFGAILVILILLYLYLPKDCKYEKKCLEDSFKNCAKANSFQIVKGNTYFYEVMGSWKDYCRVNIKVMEIAGSDNYTKSLLENKGMLCRIPKEQLNNVSITNVDNLLDYCTGPLKESMLELIIKRLYEVVIANIGKISVDMQNSLNKK